MIACKNTKLNYKYSYVEKRRVKFAGNQNRWVGNNEIEIDGGPKPVWITCVELNKLVKESSASMLIIDCRPRDEFAASKLIYKECFNVPEEIIRKGYDFDKFRWLFNVDLIE